MDCLLCHSVTILVESEAFACTSCGLVFKNPSLHLNTDEDFQRYSFHQNDKNDQGYIDFLNKLIVPLVPFLPSSFKGLDFGCGPGPTLGLLLKNYGGSVANYDPIFFPDDNLLKNKYEVVTSTEVVEHFKDPEKNWEGLVDRVQIGGVLGIMTQFMRPDIDYRTWWYKNDFTHVVFYQEKTLHFLASKFNLEIVYNDKKSVVIFKKRER